jgi:hypothetical protein
MYSPPIDPTTSICSALSPQSEDLVQGPPTTITQPPNGSDFHGAIFEDVYVTKSDHISAKLLDQKHLEKVTDVGECVETLGQDGSRLEKQKDPTVNSSKLEVEQEDTSRKRVACPKCDRFRGRPSEVK